MEASKRPPGQHPGGVLHQRKALPYSYTTITLTGLLLTAAMGYLVLYVNKKPQATATDVAKVTLGAANPQDTRPHK
ncbi:putative transmembrane protein [Senna tora]|uniref:Putative transmembrane protein n=1 Tax=Senna tora TaxID=362788 RepID=A0A834WDS8_9FABA|nr:putative transmembrane protein [Senna tora]